jgi:hypothetical protein
LSLISLSLSIVVQPYHRSRVFSAGLSLNCNWFSLLLYNWIFSSIFVFFSYNLLISWLWWFRIEYRLDFFDT